MAVGCSKAPSEDQCRQLLDHLVDLEIAKIGATATDATKQDLAKQKETVASAKVEGFMEVCRKQTHKSRVECALAAKDLEAFAKCDEQK